MKTVAVTLDDASLKALDKLASDPRARSRSAVVREAVLALARSKEQLEQEERERAILRKHHATLRRQAAALIREQADS